MKQLLLTPERTYRRKIRELVLARRLEQRFSKDEILFLYLNEIYFGSGAYGIAEAARTYFAKEAAELTVAEAALLAGMPKAPGRFSPHVNPARAEERRRWVVDRMLEEGFIDAATHREAQAPPDAGGARLGGDLAAAYFTENVRRRLVALLGNEVLLQRRPRDRDDARREAPARSGAGRAARPRGLRPAPRLARRAAPGEARRAHRGDREARPRRTALEGGAEPDHDAARPAARSAW